MKEYNKYLNKFLKEDIFITIDDVDIFLNPEVEEINFLKRNGNIRIGSVDKHEIYYWDADPDLEMLHADVEMNIKKSFKLDFVWVQEGNYIAPSDTSIFNLKKSPYKNIDQMNFYKSLMPTFVRVFGPSVAFEMEEPNRENNWKPLIKHLSDIKD